MVLTRSADDFYEHQPQSSVGQALQQLLPHGCDTLIEYYIHVSAFVFAHSQAELIIRFSKLALTSIEAVHESTKVSVLASEVTASSAVKKKRLTIVLVRRRKVGISNIWDRPVVCCTAFL
jgi:hypothetical protein